MPLFLDLWSKSLFRQFTVHSEQRRHALALRHLGAEAVGLHHEAVVLAVGLQQLLRHQRGVVEVGKRGVGVQGTRIEDGLRRLLYLLLEVGRGGRPREVVVNDVLAVAVIALQATAHRTHPCYVNVALQYAEMVEGGGGDEKYKIARKRTLRDESHRHILSLFRRY